MDVTVSSKKGHTGRIDFVVPNDMIKESEGRDEAAVLYSMLCTLLPSHTIMYLEAFFREERP